MYENQEDVFTYPRGVKYYKSFIRKEREKINAFKSRGFANFDKTKLNYEQTCAFEIVERHFNSGSEEQLKFLVKGVAGSGKSYLIGCMADLLGDACLLLAPTGVSALNIGGQTIHSAFKFPYCGSLEAVTNPGSEDYEPVPSDIQRLDNEICTLQETENVEQKIQLRNSMFIKLEKIHLSLAKNMQSVKYLVMDELSMIGCRLFGFLNRRCQQLRMSHLDWGNMSIVVLGDLGQLMPVLDTCLYSKSVSENTLAASGARLYNDIDTVICLIHQIRQNDPSEVGFRELLLRLRNGKPTATDLVKLNERNIHQVLDRDEESDDEAVHLFGTNAEANTYNR